MTWYTKGHIHGLGSVGCVDVNNYYQYSELTEGGLYPQQIDDFFKKLRPPPAPFLGTFCAFLTKVSIYVFYIQNFGQVQATSTNMQKSLQWNFIDRKWWTAVFFLIGAWHHEGSLSWRQYWSHATIVKAFFRDRHIHSKSEKVCGVYFLVKKKHFHPLSSMFIHFHPFYQLSSTCLPWSALVCFGLPWSALICLGLPWSALVCFGLLWSALVCLGLIWSDLVCLGLHRSALVCLGCFRSP